MRILNLGRIPGKQRYHRVRLICLDDIVDPVTRDIHPRQIFSFFTADAEVLAIGLKYLPIGALLFYGAASRAPANALVNGSGNYAANFATAILDGIILRIGLALLFGLTLGMKHYGFWLGDAVAGFTPMFIAAYLLARGSWKKSKLVK